MCTLQPLNAHILPGMQSSLILIRVLCMCVCVCVYPPRDLDNGMSYRRAWLERKSLRNFLQVTHWRPWTHLTLSITRSTSGYPCQDESCPPLEGGGAAPSDVVFVQKFVTHAYYIRSVQLLYHTIAKMFYFLAVPKTWQCQIVVQQAGSKCLEAVSVHGMIRMPKALKS